MRTFAQKQNQSQKPISSSVARPARATSEPTHREHSISQALTGISRPDAREVEAVPGGTALPRLGHDFSRIRVHAPTAESRQTRLAINQPGDEYEQEADRISEQVMVVPPTQGQRTPVRHYGTVREEQLPWTPAARGITPLIRAKGSGGAMASEAATTEIAATRGGGSPLPSSSRRLMESRFGTDFSHVRIHTGDYAAQLSRGLRAKAFTVGSDIYFNSRNFSPDSSEGRYLLAHELTHTVQQRSVSNSPAEAQLMIQKADGDKATTAFGEFEAVKYHVLKRKTDSKEVGVEMFLKFNPGAKVDAKQIALTQAATGKVGGTSAAAGDPNFGRRSATTGAGQGEFIDVLPKFPSPLYSTADKPTAGADAQKLTSYPTLPSTALTPAEATAQETATGVTGGTRTGFGKHGFRFTEAGKLKGPESAELYDSPQLGVANDSEQIFESTALAIEGTQKDTYYGSVNWGWKRDAAGKFSMVPFKAISQGTPSVNFLTAASIWNTASEEFNWGVSAGTANILDTTDMSKTKAAVTRGTALTWGGMHGAAGGVDFNVVTVKDGPSKGTAGAIKSTEMAMMDVGRATVDLPITEVHTTNAAAVSMVSDPAKAATTQIKALPKDTRVTVTDAKTNPDWFKIRIVDGPDTNKEGWVKKTLLTKEALGTH